MVVWQLQGIMITIIAIVVVLLSARLRRPLGAQLAADGRAAGEPVALQPTRQTVAS